MLIGNESCPFDVGYIFEAAGHDMQCLLVVVCKDEASSKKQAGRSCGAAASEEVEDGVAGIRRDFHDTLENAQRLLSWVAGLFLAVGWDDGVPPYVWKALATRSFLCSHEAGGHVGDALYSLVVESVVCGIFDVHEDVVGLGRPLLSGPGPVIVRPDYLVEKAIATKDRVQQHLAVVDFAVVNMEIKASTWRKNAICLS